MLKKEENKDVISMKISIFTPTYNRSHLLKNVFDFIVNEHYEEIEWIIVDDGSTDSTKLVVENFIEKNIVEIKYIFQENQGKHVAYNKAIDIAQGDVFICIDSDDTYKFGALNSLREHWLKLDNNDYAGLCYLSSYKNGELIGTKFPSDNMDSDLISIYYSHKVKGDKGIMFNLSILKKFKFPVFENEKFVAESVLYGKIGEKYKMKFINEIFEVKEYQKEGLSDRYRHLVKSNPKGSFEKYLIISKYPLQGVDKIKVIVQLLRFTFKNNYSWKSTYLESKYRVSFLLFTPIGWILRKK